MDKTMENNETVYSSTNLTNFKEKKDINISTDNIIQEFCSMGFKVETETTKDREEVISNCQDLYEKMAGKDITLDKKYHKLYMDHFFQNPLPSQFKSLDASQPWLLYWLGNSLKTMDSAWLIERYKRGIVQKLYIISPSGGPFSGGLGQLPHLATNYAAINALVLCDNIDECWDRIDTNAIYSWLISLKTSNGGFRTCSPVGEIDTRGVYTALSVASILGIMSDDLTEGVCEFLVQCQTSEGGFGGYPEEDEAHGGYTFCAVASLAILGCLDKINMDTLMEWCSARQFNEEKGFSGRSNKLVDGCYSFWVGGTSAILEAYGYGICINKRGLEKYILTCCQSEDRPGLRDKPGTNPDFYHTNYVTLGLVITQYKFYFNGDPVNIEYEKIPTISNIDLTPINPIYGIPVHDLKSFAHHFNNK